LVRLSRGSRVRDRVIKVLRITVRVSVSISGSGEESGLPPL